MAFLNRSSMIQKLEENGKFYNWKRFKDSQIFVMYQRYVLKK